MGNGSHLAETFSNREVHDGTCYRAAGWLPVGESKGYARHRADFYREHGQPKRLWLKPLQADAKEILCALVLPQAQLQGGHSAAAGVLPLTQPQCYSLSVPWPCCAALRSARRLRQTPRKSPVFASNSRKSARKCPPLSQTHDGEVMKAEEKIMGRCREKI